MPTFGEIKSSYKKITLAHKWNIARKRPPLMLLNNLALQFWDLLISRIVFYVIHFLWVVWWNTAKNCMQTLLRGGGAETYANKLEYGRRKNGRAVKIRGDVRTWSLVT